MQLLCNIYIHQKLAFEYLITYIILFWYESQKQQLF